MDYKKELIICLLLVISISSTATFSSNDNDYSRRADGIQTATEVKVNCSSWSDCHSPWKYCYNGTCTCGRIPFDVGLTCETGKNSSSSHGFCVTVDQSSYSTYIGHCFYANYESMCDYFNMTGILCGNCKDGHYPLAYSFDMNCVECPNGKSNWWKFALAAFLPLTFFYFIVVLFKINITSSHLQGFVFFCQGSVMPALARAMLMNTSFNKKIQQNCYEVYRIIVYCVEFGYYPFY